MTEAKHTELQAGEYLTQQDAWGRISELESRNTALVEALSTAISLIELKYGNQDDVASEFMRKARATLKQAKGES